MGNPPDKSDAHAPKTLTHMHLQDLEALRLTLEKQNPKDPRLKFIAQEEQSREDAFNNSPQAKLINLRNQQWDLASKLEELENIKKNLDHDKKTISGQVAYIASSGKIDNITMDEIKETKEQLPKVNKEIADLEKTQLIKSGHPITGGHNAPNAHHANNASPHTNIAHATHTHDSPNGRRS